MAQEYQFTKYLQQKILAALWFDNESFGLYRDTIKPKYFVNQIHTDLCRIIFDYRNKYGSAPSMEALIEEVTQFCKPKHKAAQLESYLDEIKALKDIDLYDIEYVKDKIILFGKQRALIEAILESSEIAATADTEQYSRIESSIKNALMVGEDISDLGTDFFADIEERIKSYTERPTVIEKIPSGIQLLDRVLQGGLGRTEMGVIVAPPGTGKALIYGTPVLTPRGYIPIEKLQIGDEVVTVDGTSTKVVGVYPHKNKSMYHVRFTMGSCVCCDEHLWQIETGEVVTTLDLKVGVAIPKMTLPMEFSNKSTHILFPNIVGRAFRERDFATLRRLNLDEERIPPEYLFGEIDTRRALLESLLGGTSYFSSYSLKLLEDVAFLAESLCYLTSSSSTEVPYKLVIRNDIPNQVVGVTYVGEYPAICIEVDHPSKLYVIKGGIVTHNTTTLTALGAGAMQHGYNVLHISLENNEAQVLRNYETSLLKHPFEYIQNNTEACIKSLLFMKEDTHVGNLRVKKYPTKGATTKTLRTLIDKYKIVQGFIPDLLIVDYGAILGSTQKYSDHRFQIESNYESLRALADEYNMALWTAAQANRGSLSKEIVSMVDLAECFAIGNVVDVMVCLCQTPSERKKEELRLWTPKIRDNADNKLLRGKILYSTKQIEMYEIMADTEETDEGTVNTKGRKKRQIPDPFDSDD